MEALLSSPLARDLALLARPSLFNIYFALASIPAGFALAVGVALAKGSRRRALSLPARAYVYAFRGSPLFIQLFMFYSAALALNRPLWRPLGIDGLVLHPLFLGPLILALNTTAYTAEIFHGAMRAVPRGELEAAAAVGMGPRRRFLSVAWPSTLRIAWPAYTNEVVFLFHATALVYFTLPVIDDQQDLMNKAGELFERDNNFSAAGLYFLAVSLAIFWIFGLAYRRMTRHLPLARRSRAMRLRLGRLRLP